MVLPGKYRQPGQPMTIAEHPSFDAWLPLLQEVKLVEDRQAVDMSGRDRLPPRVSPPRHGLTDSTCAVWVVWPDSPASVISPSQELRDGVGANEPRCRSCGRFSFCVLFPFFYFLFGAESWPACVVPIMTSSHSIFHC